MTYYSTIAVTNILSAITLNKTLITKINFSLFESNLIRVPIKDPKIEPRTIYINKLKCSKSDTPIAINTGIFAKWLIVMNIELVAMISSFELSSLVKTASDNGPVAPTIKPKPV
jgi:hypothetical protein